ncbi:Regulation of nuclear pre-mRNA domain-containing protein 2 [Bagarius yarrelli]|uniref:Regulation of nuclear pre-mRNA domain-containing protein 2 n=1 Tax=Bagarius yarrelli TaxID=175774 RepID=A0A556U1L0_BAGYA|nr:Regulation of nuclear pre-mRNA domain-containing protein 2 [Bagarius yarrelli]
MAAGAEAATSGGGGGGSSGVGSRSSSLVALEASLDRRFQGVSNTMESIQSLSSWCLENKKQHRVVVRYWMKWLKKSDANHRLNLFYLANDVIQNCKRKNAIIYRGTFAEILPGAALLVRDAKVRKSVERIFNIWQERSVYPEELITELKANLQKKETTPPSVTPKAAIKSKILAEFSPQAFIDRLSAYKRAVEESELKEKQLAALRVDVCSTEALKQLKDKAGGNKFSKDFEEGSMKLQEVVQFLEGQKDAGPALLEALGNADIFYEMQYKEVKIVANAYKTFANRVSNLKRKLDALKATLPEVESPVPSPTEDAPSPSGSESSFHGLGRNQRTKEEKDNRDVEDMDMSDEEVANTASRVVEDKKEKIPPPAVSKVTTSTAAKSPTLTPPTKATSEPVAIQAVSVSTVTTPTSVLSPTPLNLANVDLGKISSILNSITNAMKNTGVSPVSRPSPENPTTQPGHTPTTKTTPAVGTAAPNPLASILSKVDISPEGILNALTKTHPHPGVFEAESNSPLIVGGDATPVRDERGGTPTQDEIVDSPCVMGHKAHVSSWGTEDNHKDRDYRTPSGKISMKNKEHDLLKRRTDALPGYTPSSSFSVQEVTTKVKTEGRRGSGGALRDKCKEERVGKKAAKKQEANAVDNERYHRIETVVSAATGDEPTTIDPHSYSNRIQTVEGIRVIGRGPRRSSGSTRGAGVWYEEAEFMEAAPLPHAGNHGLESSGDLTASAQGHLVVPQGQYTSPPPPPFFPPSQSPAPLVVPPPHIAPPTPPPLTPTRDFPHSPTTSAVMVGGILVPIDRVLPLPPANLRPEALAAHGGGSISSNNSRAKSHSMRPHHRPLLGERPTSRSPTTPTTPTTPIPSREPRPLLPSPPRPLLRLPSQRLPLPLPRDPLLPGGKRNAPTYRGGSGRGPKRPFLPPRY